jgi:hypothetical protein
MIKGVTLEGYGCNGSGCILECRYFGDYGRIEDEEVIEKHNKFVESCKVVEPPSEEEMRQAEKELGNLLT